MIHRKLICFLDILITKTFRFLSEFGKNITLDNFERSIITFRCSGAIYSAQIDVYCDAVHRLLADGMWMQALKVCRKAKVRTFKNLTIKLLRFENWNSNFGT